MFIADLVAMWEMRDCLSGFYWKTKPTKAERVNLLEGYGLESLSRKDKTILTGCVLFFFFCPIDSFIGKYNTLML